MDEISKLKEENKILKALLKDLGYVFLEEHTHLVKEKRLQIYMSYFKGRNDVYASRYYSKKNQKFQYSFECQNKFKPICLISKKQKCNSDCHFYKPTPISEDVILKHMKESLHGIGIYPLLENDTCYFLAIDFDGDLWFENLLSVYRSAKKHSISCLMEKSQSGNGGHLWIFFETSILAFKARALGDTLLKDAMASNRHLSFSSFDRMFPSQDYLSGKGLGNLIALPLQYDAVKNGNSVFINEFQEGISKPFHYLLSTAKVKEEIVDQLIKHNDSNIKEYFDDKTLNVSLLDQITEPLSIKEDSMIHISKKDLSAKSLLTIRKISSTYNPEYYMNLRLHLSVYNIPRILCENIEDDKEIIIPRGLKGNLYNYIHKNNVTFDNQVIKGNSIDISFKGALRPNQQDAADALLKHDIAILEAIPGFGKTIIALYIMATLQKNTLIIVNSKDLLIQWEDKIDEFIDYPKFKLKRDHYIGKYYSNKKRLTHNIDIALIQSLAKIEDFSIIQNYGLVLIDECHHASSSMFRTILRNINSQYIYSFSGTPQRKDQLDKIIYMYLGDIVYKTNKKEIIKNRDFEQILIPRMTTFKVIDHNMSYVELCNALYQNQKRNYLIVQDIAKEIEAEKNIIILTDRKEHIQILYNQLKYNNYPIYCMSGINSSKERKEIKKQIESSDHYLIIATSQLLGEGFDLPSLNRMFITMPISYEGRLSQYVGRLHREYAKKKNVKVYDYVDVNIPMFQKMFKKRLNTYKLEGYNTIENEQIVEFDKVIFDKANYEYYLHFNMTQSKKSIIIFANDCKINRIQRLYSFLISLLSKGIKIFICINNKHDLDTIHYLEGVCSKIIYCQCTINAIMIDEMIVWTGSSSYFGIQSTDLFYLKTNEENVVDELLSLATEK